MPKLEILKKHIESLLDEYGIEIYFNSETICIKCKKLYVKKIIKFLKEDTNCLY